MGIKEPWWREDSPRNVVLLHYQHYRNDRGGWWEGGRAYDNITMKSIKILGGNRSSRESLWVETPRSDNKNMLQDGTKNADNSGKEMLSGVSKAANLGQVVTAGNVSYPCTGQVGVSLGSDEGIALLDVTEDAH